MSQSPKLKLISRLDFRKMALSDLVKLMNPSTEITQKILLGQYNGSDDFYYIEANDKDEYLIALLRLKVSILHSMADNIVHIVKPSGKNDLYVELVVPTKLPNEISEVQEIPLKDYLLKYLPLLAYLEGNLLNDVNTDACTFPIKMYIPPE